MAKYSNYSFVTFHIILLIISPAEIKNRVKNREVFPIVCWLSGLGQSRCLIIIVNDFVINTGMANDLMMLKEISIWLALMYFTDGCNIV